jgi:hypothetical protein
MRGSPPTPEAAGPWAFGPRRTHGRAGGDKEQQQRFDASTFRRSQKLVQIRRQLCVGYNTIYYRLHEWDYLEQGNQQWEQGCMISPFDAGRFSKTRNVYTAGARAGPNWAYQL